MKIVKTIICLFVLSLFCSCSSNKDIEIENAEKLDECIYLCAYIKDQRKFSLYLPSSIQEEIPAILALHGSSRSVYSFKEDTHLDDIACSNGYAVIYVEALPNKIDKTIPTGWNSGVGDTGNDDLGFLRSLAKYTQEEFSFDPNRTYICGFSNGAFMVHRLALEANDVFKGFVSISGMLPKSIWDNKKSIEKINLLQVNGTKDDAVSMHLNGSANYSKDTAIEDVINYYINQCKLDNYLEEQYTKRTTIYKYENSKSKAWFALIEDDHHSWPQEKYMEFDAGNLIIEFFDSLND